MNDPNSSADEGFEMARNGLDDEEDEQRLLYDDAEERRTSFSKQTIDGGLHQIREATDLSNFESPYDLNTDPGSVMNEQDQLIQEAEEAEDREERSAIFETRLDAANDRKEKGNECFKAKEWRLAREFYEKGLYQCEFDELQWNFELADEHREKVVTVRTPLLLNAAACSLKLDDGTRVVEYCTEAIKLDPNNTKAYFRRGQGYQTLGEYEKAKQDLATVLKRAPNDKLVRKTYKSVIEALKEEEKHKKQLWGGKLLEREYSPLTPKEHQMDNTKTLGAMVHGKSHSALQDNLCWRVMNYVMSFFTNETYKPKSA